MVSPSTSPTPQELERLVDFVERSRRLFVLTGAGSSTDSGIPDYRDAEGEWKSRPPIQYLDFVRREAVRRRYWARSFAGWPTMASARPSGAHHSLAHLETEGRIHHLVTQNVDGLHQKAGSRRVIDLHGRIDAVECMACGHRMSRADVQHLLVLANPRWQAPDAEAAPDGDAHVDPDVSSFDVPSCPECGGVLKPGVVFFGESVPSERVQAAYDRLGEADAVLVVGSSLMVYSGYRFVRAGADRGLPIAAVNLGRTRADARFTLKVEAPCAPVLDALLARIV